MAGARYLASELLAHRYGDRVRVTAVRPYFAETVVDMSLQDAKYLAHILLDGDMPEDLSEAMRKYAQRVVVECGDGNGG
jgi:hypothetical protein